jgi:hypothetical protein
MADADVRVRCLIIVRCKALVINIFEALKYVFGSCIYAYLHSYIDEALEKNTPGMYIDILILIFL